MVQANLCVKSKVMDELANACASRRVSGDALPNGEKVIARPIFGELNKESRVIVRALELLKISRFFLRTIPAKVDTC